MKAFQLIALSTIGVSPTIRDLHSLKSEFMESVTIDEYGSISYNDKSIFTTPDFDYCMSSVLCGCKGGVDC